MCIYIYYKNTDRVVICKVSSENLLSIEGLVFNSLTNIFSIENPSVLNNIKIFHIHVFLKVLKKIPSLHFPLSNHQHQLSYTGVKTQNYSRRQNPHLVFYSNVLRGVQDTKGISSKTGKSCTRWVCK